MFSGIKKILGVITVSEDNDNNVVVQGVPGYFIERDIAKLWKTSKISMHMFVKITRSSFTIPKFFLLDLAYILEEICLSKKIDSGSKRTSRKILDALYEQSWLKSTQQDITRGLDFSKQKLFYKTPLGFQEEFLKSYDSKTAKYNLNGYLLNGAAGSGKAQPLNALIKVPGGWTTMGEIKVGDSVTSKNGTPIKVTAVFPQGKKQVFKLTFADGRTTEACGEHLWNITRRKRINKQETNEYFKETVNTYKLIEYLQGSLAKRIYIDLPDSEDVADVELAVDPYLLGVIIGDGGITTGLTTITTPDEFIINEITNLLPDNVCISKLASKDRCQSYNLRAIEGSINNLTRSLIELEMFFKRSHEKTIPEVYLLKTSYKQRLALLQGLMDTDGTVDIQGTCSYSTTSHTLAQNVQYLVRSLGGIASISLKHPTYSHNGEKKNGRVAYQINIRYKKPSELFRLPKKKERTDDNGQYCNTLKLRLESIQAGDYKECQCISVDSPDHLYITNDFIVTHNTYTTMLLSEMLHADHVIVICPNNAVYRVWRDSLENEYKDPPTYWISSEDKPYLGQKFLVAHYERLTHVTEVTKNLKGRIVVILDECHNLNEMTSQRTNIFINLCKQVQSKDVIWASGTPIKAIGSESIPLFFTIDPFFNDDVYFRFKKMYGKDAKKALDILNNRISLVSHVIEKKELKLAPPLMENISVTTPNGKDFTLDSVKKDMVSFTEERYKYYANRKKGDEEFFEKCLKFYHDSCVDKNKLSEFETYAKYVKLISQISDYHNYKDEMIFCTRFEKQEILTTIPAEWRKQFIDVKSVIKYLKLKIQGECLGRVLGKKRMECVMAISEHIDYVKIIESTEKKTLIFTSYVPVLERCKEKLTELELQPLVVYGKTNKELNETIEKFGKDPNMNPLVATYPSLSTAVPLVMADVMIMLNAPYRDYVHQQAISRIHRLGSNTQVTVYIAALDTGKEPNLSSRTIDILKWSQEQVAAITGVKSPFEIEESGVTLEDINGRQPTEFDIKISMEELGIEEIFDFTAGLPTSINMKNKPAISKW